jgi:hypothetical protein
MKTRLLPTLFLLVVLVAACAPVAGTEPPSAAVDIAPSAAPLVESSLPTLEAATPAPAVEIATALPVATSRGPDLEATDPGTVSLASGGLHFVEFFRFT